MGAGSSQPGGRTARRGHWSLPGGQGGINTVMRRIQNAIIERGFITTRILAEPQDLKAGELKLTVIPGRVRAVRTTAETPGRATLWNALPVRPGELLNLRDVEQGLENLKRIPTAEADIQIAPAEGEQVRPGESDLLVSWRQGFPFRLPRRLSMKARHVRPS